MKEVFELTDAIQWHEGMLLTPQHFQQLALRQEQLLHYHTMVSTPFFWGVRHLKIDPVLLLNGRLNILELEAVMPDGLLIWHIAGDDSLDIDLSSHAERIKIKDLPVYLAVPARRSDSNAFQGELARYHSAESRPVVDDNTGEGAVRIPRLKPRVRLLVGDEPSSKYTCFPLARITYKNETFALSEFIPPTLSVLPHSPLHEMSTVIATRVREKAGFLSERLRLPSFFSRMDKPLLYETRNLIQGLVAALPPLEAMLYAKQGHPYPLYLSLCALAGSMAGYAGAQLPPVFPAYQHNDLHASFTPVLEFIGKILDSIHESYVALPFQFENNRFVLLPHEDWMQDKIFVIGIRGGPGIEEQQLMTWMDNALIGTSEHMSTLQANRILGSARERVEKVVELDLLPTKGLLLFEVESDPHFISPGDLLEIINTSADMDAFRPSEIIFYAKNTPE